MTTVPERTLVLVVVIYMFSILFYDRIIVQSQIPNTLLVPVGSEVFARCSCGKMRDMNAAKEGDFPWTAALVDKDDYSNEPLCWGVVINSRYILSAAHCTAMYKSNYVEIFIAASDLMSNPRREVSNIKIHPGFVIGDYTYDNDISLIKLRDPLDLEAGDVYPICLPPTPRGNFSLNANELDDCDFESELEGKTATMNKFKGYRTDGNTRTYQFRQADFRILTTSNCTDLYPKRVRAQTLCGEAHYGLPWNFTMDNCHKDPGAPLLHVRQMKAGCDADFEQQKENSMQIKYTQVGLSTAQQFCKGYSDSKPTLLFTKMTRYVDWIYENTMDGQYCMHSKI